MTTPTPDPIEQRAHLDAQFSVKPDGEFEIIAITAGTGNGWQFSADVLQASLELWERVDCFVDHSWFAHSLRDLGGVCYAPAWNAEKNGIQLKLKALGPSADIVKALGRDMLGADAKPTVGFSADLIFTASGKVVKTILKVFSLDLVYNPARGGEFLRALNQHFAAAQPPGGTMPEPTQAQTAPAPAAAEQNPDVAAIRNLLQVTQEQQAIAAQVEAAKQARAQMCAYLLDAGLTASKLPAAMQNHVRAQFKDRIFDNTELNAAIENARKLVSELTGPQTVSGMRAQVSGMFNSEDQITAAVQDLFGIERDEHLKGVKPHKLSGIRELYLGLTGDLDFYGGYDLSRAMFQHTTTTFAGLVKNAMNKALVERWNELGRAGYDWWEKIVKVEHFADVKTVTWMIFGTIASLPTVSEGAEYTELKIADSPETSSFTKYGGYVGITLEALINDDTRKLRAIPRELASGAIRNISSLVAAIFTNNSGVGPTLADTGALFNNTAVTTAGGHANLLTTALGTDYTAWNAVAKAVYNQPMLVANETGYYGTGKKMAIFPKYALVPIDLKSQADALFVPRWASSGYMGTAPAAGTLTYAGMVEPIVVPEWTDATDWAAVVDPNLVPGIMIGEAFGLKPEIFIAGDQNSPAMFSNDESRIKVRHFLTVGVADFRPLHKENVA